MSDIAIKVEGLSKRYRIGANQQAFKTLREKLNGVATAPFRAARHLLTRNGNGNSQFAIRNSKSATIWALKDVSFEVKRGEVVGIIGRNGAGKSTLLKILSRITEPTEGYVDIHGRVGSLLEVGTGFHPELTGRENIFLNGSILGMKRVEINKKFDEMVAFAEIDRFIDTPVKYYSSGMYVRLAFAVAAHLDPEILLVDEVLAVGDASFQKKCLGKMGDVAREGRTVIFVSHNMIAVQSLCRRVLMLGDGSLLDDGSAANVIGQYLRLSCGPDQNREWTNPLEAPGDETVRVKSVRVLPQFDGGEAVLTMKTPVKVVTEFWILKPGVQTHITYHLINDHGIVVLTTVGPSARLNVGFYRASFDLPGNLLNSGSYQLRLLIVKNENQVTYEHQSLASFTIHDLAERSHAWLGREPGVVQPVFRWDVQHASETEVKKPATLLTEDVRR